MQPQPTFPPTGPDQNPRQIFVALGVASPEYMSRRRFPLWATAALGVAVLGLGAYLALRIPASPPSSPLTDAKSAADAKPSPSAAAKPPTDLAAKSAAKSIAVLPFANRSTDKENEFFTDGMHEDILT